MVSTNSVTFPYPFDHSIVEAPLTEAKVREVILTRLYNKDLFYPQMVSDEEEQCVDESEIMSSRNT